MVDTRLPGKASKRRFCGFVLETDTGGQGEYPKALEKTLVKELGKIVP